MQREKDALVPKEKGNDAFKKGDYDKALGHYMEATRIDPANPALYTNAAQAYIKMGDFEAAVERCDIGIRADDRCVKAHLRRGIAKRALGEYDDALKSFKDAKACATKAQQANITRQVEDTKLAMELAEREARVIEGAADKSGAGMQFKAIELACAKLLTSSLDTTQVTACLQVLRECVQEELYQDMFRLRQGMRIMADNHVCKQHLQALRGTPSDATSTVSPVHTCACVVCFCVTWCVCMRRGVFLCVLCDVVCFCVFLCDVVCLCVLLCDVVCPSRVCGVSATG